MVNESTSQLDETAAASLEAWFRQALRSNHLRNTAGRRAVLDAIGQRLQRFTPEELVAVSEAGRATVYRTLKLLMELGLICRVTSESGQAYYHFSPRPHRQHLVCAICGLITDLESGPLEAAIRGSVEQNGFETVTFRLEAVGICPSCQQGTTNVPS
jgi:Fur family ferric uptake transcriptional regulator